MNPKYIAILLNLTLLLVGYQEALADPTEGTEHKHSHSFRHWEIASSDPDRIFLSFHGDAATRRAVTWRTDTSVEKAFVEIAPALAEPGFDRLANQPPA